MNRRGFIGGVSAFLCAPAIVKASNIMPVRALPPPTGNPHIFTASRSGFYKITNHFDHRLQVFGAHQVGELDVNSGPIILPGEQMAVLTDGQNPMKFLLLDNIESNG